MSMRGLSKSAKEIAKLASDGKTLGQIIQQKPELAEAIDEYQRWVEEQKTATADGIPEPPPISHPLLGG
jgi:hypothetical protein